MNKKILTLYAVLTTAGMLAGLCAAQGQQPRQIKEVVVAGRKPLVKQEADRVIYDVQADPDSKSSSVLEIMRKVPFLSLGAGNNILLKGEAGYRIFVNGKPSGMLEHNPQDILRSMPASTIVRIEVITTPGAKYDAEGVAGIINIITQKRTHNGYNGTLNANARFPAGGPGAGGSFTAKAGRLGMAVFAGASRYDAPRTDQQLLRTAAGTHTALLEQAGGAASRGRNAYFNTEIGFEIDSLQLLAAQLNLFNNKQAGVTGLHIALHDMSGDSRRYTQDNDHESLRNGLDASLNYQLSARRNKDRMLTLSYRYMTFNSDQYNNLAITGREQFDDPDFRQYNNQDVREHTFQADYVYPARIFSMEAGVKGILRNNSSNFYVYTLNASDGKFAPDPARSGRLDYDQQVWSAYNSYQFRLKQWSMKAGARIERTVIDADFVPGASQVRQRYFNVIPSLAILHKLRNGQSLNFGFTQRIKRPGIHKLNPFVDRSDPSVESSGNSHLRPVLLSDVMLGYSRQGRLSLNAGMNYGFGRNLDLRVTLFDPVTNVMRITYENTGKAAALNGNLNISYAFTKKWEAGLNGRLGYITMEGMVDGAPLSGDWVVYSATLSAGYRFEKAWRASAALNVVSRNPASLQVVSNGLVSTSLSVAKGIIKDRLSCAATINNPFTQYRHNITETSGPGFLETSRRQEYFRSCSIQLNYNFGMLKEPVKKNKRGIQNDDVSNGN